MAKARIVAIDGSSTINTYSVVRGVSTVLYIQITTLAATTVTELIASGHTNSGWAVFEPGRIRIFCARCISDGGRNAYRKLEKS